MAHGGNHPTPEELEALGENRTTRDANRQTVTERAASGPGRSLLGQTFDVAKAAPLGLLHFGGGAVVDAYKGGGQLLLRGAYETLGGGGLGGPAWLAPQEKPEGYRSNTTREFLSSFGRTAGRVGEFGTSLVPGGLRPQDTEYGKAVRDSEIVGLLLEDVGNLALAGGVVAKGASFGGRTVAAGSARRAGLTRVSKADAPPLYRQNVAPSAKRPQATQRLTKKPRPEPRTVVRPQPPAKLAAGDILSGSQLPAGVLRGHKAIDFGTKLRRASLIADQGAARTIFPYGTAYRAAKATPTGKRLHQKATARIAKARSNNALREVAKAAGVTPDYGDIQTRRFARKVRRAHDTDVSLTVTGIKHARKALGDIPAVRWLDRVVNRAIGADVDTPRVNRVKTNTDRERVFAARQVGLAFFTPELAGVYVDYAYPKLLDEYQGRLNDFEARERNAEIEGKPFDETFTEEPPSQDFGEWLGAELEISVEGGGLTSDVLIEVNRMLIEGATPEIIRGQKVHAGQVSGPSTGRYRSGVGLSKPRSAAQQRFVEESITSNENLTMVVERAEADVARELQISTDALMEAVAEYDKALKRADVPPDALPEATASDVAGERRGGKAGGELSEAALRAGRDRARSGKFADTARTKAGVDEQGLTAEAHEVLAREGGIDEAASQVILEEVFDALDDSAMDAALGSPTDEAFVKEVRGQNREIFQEAADQLQGDLDNILRAGAVGHLEQIPEMAVLDANFEKGGFDEVIDHGTYSEIISQHIFGNGGHILPGQPGRAEAVKNRARLAKRIEKYNDVVNPGRAKPNPNQREARRRQLRKEGANLDELSESARADREGEGGSGVSPDISQSDLLFHVLDMGDAIVALRTASKSGVTGFDSPLFRRYLDSESFGAVNEEAAYGNYPDPVSGDPPAAKVVRDEQGNIKKQRKPPKPIYRAAADPRIIADIRRARIEEAGLYENIDEVAEAHMRSRRADVSEALENAMDPPDNTLPLQPDSYGFLVDHAEFGAVRAQELLGDRYELITTMGEEGVWGSELWDAVNERAAALDSNAPDIRERLFALFDELAQDADNFTLIDQLAEYVAARDGATINPRKPVVYEDLDPAQQAAFDAMAETISDLDSQGKIDEATALGQRAIDDLLSGDTRFAGRVAEADSATGRSLRREGSRVRNDEQVRQDLRDDTRQAQTAPQRRLRETHRRLERDVRGKRAVVRRRFKQQQRVLEAGVARMEAVQADIQTKPARWRTALSATKSVVDEFNRIAEQIDDPVIAGILQDAVAELPLVMAEFVDRGVNPGHRVGGPDMYPGGGVSSQTFGKRMLRAEHQKEGTSTNLTMAHEKEALVSALHGQYTNAMVDRIIHNGWAPQGFEFLGDVAENKLVAAASEMGLVPWDPTNPWRDPTALTVNHDTRFIPKTLKKQATTYFGPRGTAENFLADWYDPVQRMWKNSVLALVPRWHVGNMVGNMMNATVAGDVPPTELAGLIRESMRELRKIQLGDTSALPRELFVGASHEGDFALSQIQHLVHGDIASNRTRKRVERDERRLSGDLAPTLSRKGLMDRTAKVVERSYGFNEYIDNVSRSVVYLDAKNRRTFSEAEAITHALAAIGDFANMTHFERSVVRRVVPFYAWLRHMSRISARLPANHPGRVAMMLGIGNAYLPEEYDGTIPFIAGSLPVGGDRFLSFNSLNPFGRLVSLDFLNDLELSKNPLAVAGSVVRAGVGAVSGNISPMIEFPTEAMTGFTFGPGGPEELRSQTVDSTNAYGYGRPANFGEDTPGILNRAINLVPQARAVRDTARAFGDGGVLRNQRNQRVLSGGRPIPTRENRLSPMLSLLGVRPPNYVDTQGFARRLEERRRGIEDRNRRANPDGPTSLLDPRSLVGR